MQSLSLTNLSHIVVSGNMKRLVSPQPRMIYGEAVTRCFDARQYLLVGRVDTGTALAARPGPTYRLDEANCNPLVTGLRLIVDSVDKHFIMF